MYIVFLNLLKRFKLFVKNQLNQYNKAKPIYIFFFKVCIGERRIA